MKSSWFGRCISTSRYFDVLANLSTTVWLATNFRWFNILIAQHCLAKMKHFGNMAIHPFHFSSNFFYYFVVVLQFKKLPVYGTWKILHQTCRSLRSFDITIRFRVWHFDTFDVEVSGCKFFEKRAMIARVHSPNYTFTEHTFGRCNFLVLVIKMDSPHGGHAVCCNAPIWLWYLSRSRGQSSSKWNQSRFNVRVSVCVLWIRMPSTTMRLEAVIWHLNFERTDTGPEMDAARHTRGVGYGDGWLVIWLIYTCKHNAENDKVNFMNIIAFVTPSTHVSHGYEFGKYTRVSMRVWNKWAFTVNWIMN